jgi:hypothetical protein
VGLNAGFNIAGEVIINYRRRTPRPQFGYDFLNWVSRRI